MVGWNEQTPKRQLLGGDVGRYDLSGITPDCHIILTVMGVKPKRVITYYLYAAYFLISMPGLFASLRGNDNRRAAYFFGILGVFNAAAAYRAETVLVLPWDD